ncbi:hypothetical protein ACVFVO_18830 [Advenella kashmirensis]
MSFKPVRTPGRETATRRCTHNRPPCGAGQAPALLTASFGMPFLLPVPQPGAAPTGELHSANTVRQQEISPLEPLHTLLAGKFAYY